MHACGDTTGDTASDTVPFWKPHPGPGMGLVVADQASPAAPEVLSLLQELEIMCP